MAMSFSRHIAFVSATLPGANAFVAGTTIPIKPGSDIMFYLSYDAHASGGTNGAVRVFFEFSPDGGTTWTQQGSLLQGTPLAGAVTLGLLQAQRWTFNPVALTAEGVTVSFEDVPATAIRIQASEPVETTNIGVFAATAIVVEKY